MAASTPYKRELMISCFKDYLPLHTSLISSQILENYEKVSSCKELPCAAIYLTLATPASCSFCQVDAPAPTLTATNTNVRE
jgi:hypothetical protein